MIRTRQLVKSILGLIGIVVVPVMFVPFAVAAGQLDQTLAKVLADKSDDVPVAVWITFKDTPDPDALKRFVTATGATRAERNRTAIELLKAGTSVQAGVLAALESHQATRADIQFKSHWIANVVEASLPANLIESIAARSDVDVIYLQPTIESIAPIEYGASAAPADISSVTDNLTHIKAPQAWAAGYTGAGRVVCNFDTGVEGTHPALRTAWKGYNGDSTAAWFDQLDGLKYPHSFPEAGLKRNHGTHTMGIMCGRNAATGDTVGVAPGAKWIAAATIDLRGASILDAFEWACDPDGDPNTIGDVPDVINHSWGYTDAECLPIFYEAIDNTEACGIVNVFAAGNSGAAAQSITNPADRALDSLDCFAVGNLNHRTNSITPSSSRGPSPCDLTKVKPNVVAPGDSIRSTWSTSSYNYLGGTSMAAPHVSGLVALLRQKNPDATVDEIKKAILTSTKRSGFGVIPNNTYGWGEIDCLAALNALAAPSVRSIKIADFRHDQISPGDTVRGTILLQNLGTQATGVSLSITGSNGGLTVLDGSASFGTIPALDSVRSSDSVVVVVSDTVTPGSVVPINVTISGTGFSTPGKLYFLIEPPQHKAFVTHQAGRMKFTVSNFGAYGLGPSGSVAMFPFGGEGFCFDGGSNVLWEGGIMVGNSFSRVSSAVHSYLFDPDMDFRVAPNGNLRLYEPGEAAFQETFSIFNDSGASNPLGLEITQQTFLFGPPDDDFVIMSYILKNTTGSSLSNLYFGLFMDWDITSYNSNCGGYNSADGIVWMAYNTGTTKSNYRGIKLIGAAPSARGAAPSAEIYPPIASASLAGPGFPTEEKFRILTSGTQYATQNANARADLYSFMSTGPLSIPAGGKDTVAFAVLAGSTYGDLQDAGSRAQFNPADTPHNPDQPDNLPKTFRLYQNYPNPFNPSTTISFDLPTHDKYTVTVINILGQTVYEVTGEAAAGLVNVIWQADKEASGVYLYRVTAGSYEASRKMMLLK